MLDDNQDDTFQTTEDWSDKQVEGFDAFEAGKSLNDNPYSFSNGRDQWSRGWLKARERAVAMFQSKWEISR